MSEEVYPILDDDDDGLMEEFDFEHSFPNPFAGTFGNPAWAEVFREDGSSYWVSIPMPTHQRTREEMLRLIDEQLASGCYADYAGEDGDKSDNRTA